MRIVCLFLWVLLVSCAIKETPSMPELFPVSPVDGQEKICEMAFIDGDWQFVHSITFETNNGYSTTLVGVTVLQNKKLKTVLMGVEGFVLFEAEQEESGKVVVRRAMSPFDKTGFAEGLMGDVQTLFVEPVSIGKVARNAEGELVCRYVVDNNGVTDVVMTGQGWDKIVRYDTQGVLEQTITARSYRDMAGERVPQQIKLRSHGIRGYTLQLQLLSAEKI
jgi:hypothetical protein